MSTARNSPDARASRSAAPLAVAQLIVKWLRSNDTGDVTSGVRRVRHFPDQAVPQCHASRVTGFVVAGRSRRRATFDAATSGGLPSLVLEVVERTLAWITAHRRCARDYERLPESHEAMVLWAMSALMTQRLAAQAPKPE
jgi:transposase